MATAPLGAESALANPLNIFATFDRATIAKTVEVLVCVLDAMEPDADLEPTGDEQDAAWIEWQTMRGSQKGGHNLTAGHEDDEEDDAPEEDDPHGACDEDEISTNATQRASLFAALHNQGPGCEISDPDAEHDGDEHSDGY